MNETIPENTDALDVYSDYNYTYDYEDNLDWLPLNELIPCVTFYVIIGLLGISGNSLVITLILAFPKMRNITNLFLFSLASADLLLVLICVPIKCATFFSYTWRMGAFLCTFTHYIQNVSMVCSVMTLTVMSIERFVAIIYPLHARSLCTSRHAKFVIGSVWILSFVSCVPILFIQDLKEVGRRIKAYWCIKRFSLTMYNLLFEIYMFFILFIIPMTIMMFTYSRISYEIWKVADRRAALSGERKGEEMSLRPDPKSSRRLARRRFLSRSLITSEESKTRKQVILMLMIIVLFFAICWGPILLNNLLVACSVLGDLHTGFLKPMRMTFHLMSYANSCVNPIVYGIMSNNFKDRLRKTFSGRMARNQSLTTRSSIPSRDSTLRNQYTNYHNLR
ncbi:allatostatin-A receptor-like isoform X2 [Ostrea edulis]|uniref:allatostatin-A receptor-like isoform X2 n=1 Tax=Ostrea edulis TaxID=37623 RepID=UPI002094D155|nr:allatostatin-A receptor-like isoform X2 [Ostrea edulis]